MAFANFSLTTVYATLISMINTQLTAVAKLFKDQTTGYFVDQVRYNSSNKKLESWDGDSWEPLDLTGVAAGTAATLQTTRTIGGVSFNGSSNIDLPGVNATGNQDTTGSAAKLNGQAASYYAVATKQGGFKSSPLWLSNNFTLTANQLGTLISILNTSGKTFILPLASTCVEGGSIWIRGAFTGGSGGSNTVAPQGSDSIEQSNAGWATTPVTVPVDSVWIFISNSTNGWDAVRLK